MTIRPLFGGQRRLPNPRNPNAVRGNATGATSNPPPQVVLPPVAGPSTGNGGAAQQSAARLANLRHPGTALTAPLPSAQAMAPAATPAAHPSIESAQAFPHRARHADRTLQGLTRLALYTTPDNESFLARLEQQLTSLPSGDPLRIDIVRVATHFVHPDPQGQVSPGTLEQLGRLAFGAAGHQATPAQIRQALGTERERTSALIDAMPRWAVGLTNLDVRLLVHRLPPSIMGRPHELANSLQKFVTTRHQLRQDHPLRLPRSNFWLDDRAQQHRIMLGYSSHVDHFGPDRALSNDLLNLATDLPALSGTKHKLVAFLSRGFAFDDARQFGSRLGRNNDPRLFESGDRRMILEALVRQLPHPGFGNPATQQDILQLVKGQFDSDGLRLDDKRRLASCLLGVAAGLPSSRIHGPADLQGGALKAVSQALESLPAIDSSQLMHEMLDGQPELSTQRRPSALAPRHRSDVRRFIESQSAGLFIPIGVGTMIGRPSPSDKAFKYVLRGLKSKLHAGASTNTTDHLLPVCQRLLNISTGPDGKQARQITAKVSAILATGGLPFGLATEARERALSLALGDVASLRGKVGRQLIGIAKAGDGSTKGQALNEQRIGAARYLHNLLATGSHDLDAGEIAQAEAAIRRACMDVQPDVRSLPIIAALLAESSAQANSTTALPTLVSKLASGFTHIDNDAAQLVIAGLTPSYAGLPPSEQNALGDAIASRLPMPPAERNPARAHDPQLRHELQAQQIGVALVGSLIRNENSLSGPLIHWAGDVFRRINPTNRSAALNMSFDGFAQASNVGRETAIRFVDTLDNSSEFTTGAIKLVQSGLADDVADQLDPTVKSMLVNTVARRLPSLQSEDASNLVRNCATSDVDLPPELMSSFIRQAPKLDASSLRGLLVSWGSNLRQHPPELNQQQHQEWTDAASHATPESADIVHAFLRVAAEAHPSQGLPVSNRAVTPEAAHQLACALPHMDASTMQAAFRHIGETRLPQEACTQVIQAVFNQLPRFDSQACERALGLCLRLDQDMTLNNLAAKFGMRIGPIHQIDKIVRLNLDQPIATLHGQATTFAEQIAGMRPDKAGSVLEILAENLFNVPPAQQHSMQQLIRNELPRLPQRHQDRVRQTYLYANPDWGKRLNDAAPLRDFELRDPEAIQRWQARVAEIERVRQRMAAAVPESIEQLGEDPRSDTWRELLATDGERASGLLNTLRQTRGQSHGAPANREEVSVDEFFTPPGSPLLTGRTSPSFWV